MRVDGRAACLAFLLIAVASQLGAQQDGLAGAVGKRIRSSVLVPSRGDKYLTRTLTGSLARLHGDTLFLTDVKGLGELAIPRGRVRWVMVSVGRRTRTGHGAVLGALIGAGTGVVSGIVICQVISSCASSGGELSGFAAVVLGFGGALAGTGVGVIAGSLSHTDRWRPVRLSGTVMPRPEGEGIRLGLSIRF